MVTVLLVLVNATMKVSGVFASISSKVHDRSIGGGEQQPATNRLLRAIARSRESG